MTLTAQEGSERPAIQSVLPLTALSALGIVFGDIGTSPLYTLREMKLRSHYEKRSERRVREKAEAIRRARKLARKLARKKMQREGLLAMKPRVIPGGPGRGGPARAPRF